MKKVFIILVIIVFISCTRKYGISPLFRNGVPADMQQLVIDSSYHLYIREVYLKTDNLSDKSVKTVSSLVKGTDKLIEIEYLLLSSIKNRVIYIATIPDKYQDYYSKKSKYLPREYLNAYDFSTFRFGINNESGSGILFPINNASHTDTWKYVLENDSVLHVYEVVERLNEDETNVYLVDEALSRSATFIRTDSFKVVFRNMDLEKKVDIKKGRPPLKRFWKDNIIYYRKENNKYTIYFRFDKSLPKRYKDSTINFNHARLVNEPFN